MNILFVSEYYPRSDAREIRGGVELRCFYVASELAKRHNVTVLTTRDKSTPSEQYINRVRVLRCGLQSRYTHKGNPIRRMSFMRSAVKSGLNLDADIVEGENFTSYLPAHKIGSIKNIPRVAMYADCWIGDWIRNLGVIGIYGELLEKNALSQKWERIVAISNSTMEKIERFNRVQNKITVIPCGVDMRKMRKIRQKIKKRRSQPTICAVSRMVKYKRVDTLIRAMNLLRDDFPNLICRIIGSGPEEKRILRMINSYNLAENVELLGFIPNHDTVMQILAESTVFVHPSEVEGFGISVVEAMSLGVPFVCSDIPAVREVTMGGTGGFLFETSNHIVLAEKCYELLNNTSLYRKKAREAVSAADKYDWKNIALTVENLYEELLAK